MSQPCAIDTCKRASRALCHCCQQNLCIVHLNEHNDVLNSQLNPLVDEINALGERLKALNIQDIYGDCRQKLEQWCRDCHKKIDHFFEQKCQELDRLVAEKLDKQRENITQIRSKVAELIRDQEATRQDIDTLTSTIRHLEKEMNKIEQAHCRIDTYPLLIDDTIVQFNKIYEHEFDLSTLSSVHRTIAYPARSSRALSSNDRLLLIHQAPNLCFLNVELTIIKQVLWPHGIIDNMCWTSTLAQFIVIVKDNIYLVDENTMSIENDDILYDIKWQSELISPVELENNFIFTSKRKEKYSCVLPTPQTTVRTPAETILLSEIEPILENLYSNGLCIYRVDPYWTYQLCHGSHIRQYHETNVDGKKTVTQDYFLGYYHSNNQDIITNSDNQQVLKIHYKTINHQEIPMFSIRYTDGTNCDINSNKPRETVVFYVCKEKGQDGIINFHEVSSCYYEMTVTLSKLCNIPAFSPEESNQYTINCYPQENALEKPRNLKKLEYEKELSSKKSGPVQFTMTSADGTTFIISYEYIDDGELKDLTNNKVTPPANEQPPPDHNDREFFEGFLSGRDCLKGGAGWWKYELCYGKHVIQFHDEGEQRTSILLGKWDLKKHIEWINTNPRKKSGGNIRDRQYVPLYYTDGDQCELTQTPRVVEVKLRCSKRADKSRTPTMYLVEPETCSYILGIESPIFCNLNDYTDVNGIPDQEKLIKRFDEQ